MPTYGYECVKCKNTFEVLQKVNDEPITVCPKCGGKTTKVFYPVGIIFKGSGFHITDYCRPKESNKEAPASEAKKDGLKTKEETPKPAKKEQTEKAS